MKRFLQHRSRRIGYDGWAVRIRGAELPLENATCTTRAEAREVRAEMGADLFQCTEVVKVKLKVEAVDG